MWIPLTLALLACTGDVFAQTSGEPADNPANGGDEKVLFADLPQVEAASLHVQTLAEAPANVSVITAEEIRRYGYRTLGEALGSVRGFYVSNDHMYRYVGVRGFSLPGDFNTGFLVMINGHPLTDNVYNSNNFFGQDFGLDMDLVERIEIIRGPTSALYGSNGMLANINIVTRSPVDSPRLRVAAEASSFNDRKLSFSSSSYLGSGANLLVSGSVFDDGGITFPLNGLALPPSVTSPVSDADGERGFHSFVNLIWRRWSFTAYFNQRDKHPPIGLGTSLSGDSSEHFLDSRNVVEASYKRNAGPGQLQWTFAYDQYRYRDLFEYPEKGEIVPVRDMNRGDWLDTQLTYDLPTGRIGQLTAGLQGFWDLRNLQYNVVGDGSIQDWISRPDRGAAVFAQQEWNLAPRWKLYTGLRLDVTRYYPSFVSPRMALVFQSSPRTVYKLVYGRPFRNPSSFEQFYNDGGLSYAAAPPLVAETADAFEGSFERKVSRNWTVIFNGYHYRIGHVIQAVSLEDEVQQYQNAGMLRSTGLEAELAGKLWKRVEAAASFAFQSALDPKHGTLLPNAPRNISKMRLGVPLGPFFFSTAWQYLSPRQTWSGSVLGGALLGDCTATVRLARSVELQAGLRNALNRRYEDPIYLILDRIRGDGRSAFVK